MHREGRTKEHEPARPSTSDGHATALVSMPLMRLLGLYLEDPWR